MNKVYCFEFNLIYIYIYIFSYGIRLLDEMNCGANLHTHTHTIRRPNDLLLSCNASFALKRIGNIRQYLDQPAAEKLIHAFVSSELDYCNSLLFGLPGKEISKLQRVQNSAARLITKTRKTDHITPILRKLHWPPVHKRIIL